MSFMKPLAWMMKKESNDNSAGGLLLLFFLLAIHLLCNLISSGADDDLCNLGDGFKSQSSALSAYQKITLGVPISINRESLEGLTAVPGIGPGIARSIARERVRRNGFKKLDEIKFIKGIGPGLYRKIKPYLKL